MLEIDTRENSREHSRAVIRLRDVLRSIPQVPVANQKIITSTGQIKCMNTRNPTGREFGTQCVERPSPPLTSNRNTSGGKTVDGCECETFRFPVIPSQPGKDADVLRELLLHIEAKTIFERSVAASCRDIGSATIQFRLPDRVGVVACVGAVLVVQQPDCTSVLPDAVSVFSFEDIPTIPK